MNGGSKKEREERAADALLVSLLRRVDKDDDYIDPKHLPQLTDEDRAALDALGADFVDRLLAGERPLAAKSGPDEDRPHESEKVALAGSGADCSFNRAEEVDDATTQELDEQEREILNAKQPASGNSVEMTPPLDIEALAKKHLVALDMWRLPVNPFAIAKEEGIELAPGEYGEKFDARIKFVRSEKTFILFYKELRYGPTEGRVRFSLGHELGHFYIPRHRGHLLRGESHNSVTDFRSRDPFEVEADAFSSALLMPHDLFAAKLKDWGLKNCNLADFCRLSEKAFETSLTSTVRRYVEFDWEECSMIISEAGAVKWAKHSESMKAIGMGYVASGTPVPNKTPTAKLWDKLENGPTLDREEGHVDADLWFEQPWRRRVWEETMPLGYTGLVLTFLVPEDSH